LRNKAIIGAILIFFILVSNGLAQEKMELPDRTAQMKLNRAVWQMDLYICTGIAYAKSLGNTAEDYGKFVGEQVLPNWAGRKGQGLAPVIQAISVRWEIYQKGTFEIVSETETSVTIRMNRPYANYFYSGDLYGVTLKEYEAFLEQMAIAIMDYLGMKYEQAVEGEYLIATIAIL
jgi:hypothetical protein